MSMDKWRVTSDKQQAMSEEGRTGRVHHQTNARDPHFSVTVIGRIREQDEADCKLRIPNRGKHPVTESQIENFKPQSSDHQVPKTVMSDHLAKSEVRGSSMNQ
jgi:hypothetical protein